MRDTRIDIIKGLSIISVIILHTLSSEFLTSIYRIFHINQAVPLFMLISGYVFTHSYKRNGIVKLKECYNINLLLKRIKRLYIPFFMVYFLQLVLIKIFSSEPEKVNFLFIFQNLILGGFGPGSYYPVIMFQFLLIFPLIYIISFKAKNNLIPIFFVIGVLFELLTYFSGIDQWIYRLLIGRYVFVIALGSYLAMNKNTMNKKFLYAGSLLSIIYMYISVYYNYQAFGHAFFTPHHAPAYFYTAFLFIVGMNYLPDKTGPIAVTLSELGKASWHIFLIQMLYFWSIGLYADNIFSIIVNMIFCLIIGYTFYKFDNFIFNFRIKHKRLDFS